jgi:hypothetical protein
MLMLKRDYDVSIEQIQCNADKIGAQVFTITKKGSLPIRVLAFEREQALFESRKYMKDKMGILELDI